MLLYQQTACMHPECSLGFCGDLTAQQWVWETSREKVNAVECREEKALNFSVVFFCFIFLNASA